MALQQLGISMVVRGAERFARDVSHVALSMYNYSKAVSAAERSMISMSQKAVNTTKAGMDQQLRVVQSISKAYLAQEKIVASLTARVTEMTNALKNQSTAANRVAEISARLKELYGLIARAAQLMKGQQDKTSVFYQTLSRATLEYYREIVQLKAEQKSLNDTLRIAGQAQKNLSSTTQQLADESDKLSILWKRLGDEGQVLADKTEENQEAQSQLTQVINSSGGIVQTLAKFFGVLSGAFGQNVIGATQLQTKLLRLGLQGAAVGIAMNTLSLALDAIAIAAKLTIGAVLLFVNALGKLLGVAANVGKAIIGWVWEGFKRLAALPFQLIIGGLTGVWNSIKRIGEIAIGMNLSNLIWHIGTQLKGLGEQAFQAAERFQLLQIRLTGLAAREMVDASEGTLTFADAMVEAKVKAQDLSYWVSNLAVKSIFSAEDISNTLTLAMAYDFTSGEAQDLTLAITNFATGMGLTDEQMRRIIENFGQMKAAGKAAGTELRDLARGSFVPVNTIFDMMGKRLGIVGKNIGEVREIIQKKISEGEIPINEFFKEFINLSARDFPDAIENASSSWKVIRSNMSDFLESVLGWRVITPVLDVISERMTKFMEGFLTPEVRGIAEKLGSAFAFVASSIGKISDALTPAFLKDSKRFVTSLNSILDALSGFKRGKINAIVSADIIIDNLKRMGIAGQGINNTVGAVLHLVNALNRLGTTGNVAEEIKYAFDSLKNVIGTFWNVVIIPAIKKIWEEKLKPKLEELWGFISGFVTDLWQNKVPAWWEETGKPAILGMIEKIVEWVKTSEDAKNIGRSIMDAIKTGLGAIKDSGIIEVLVSGLTSAATIAATTVMETITGILSGGGAVGDNTPVQYKQASGVATSISELAASFEKLKQASSGAFKESIISFLQTLKEESPGAFAAVKIIAGIAASIEILGKVAGQFMEPIMRIGDAIFSIISNITGAGGKGSITGAGGAGGIDVIGKIAAGLANLAALPLDFIATNLEAISLAIKNITGGSAGGDTGAIGSFFSNIVTKGAEVVTEIIAKFKELSTEIGASAKVGTEAVTQAFQGLGNTLVWGSIIPEMMQAIFEVISTTLTDLVAWINDNFVSPVSNTFNQMDLYAAGLQIVQSLWDGLAAGIPALLEWWNGIKSQFSITVTVGFDLPESAPSGSTPAKPKKGSSGSGSSGNKPGQTPPKLKSGANFIVPPGFPNDSFGINVTSGEQIIVIPNAIAKLSNRSSGKTNPFAINQNISGGFGNSYSNSTNKTYNLNVNTSRELETIQTEYEIMRLIDETGRI